MFPVPALGMSCGGRSVLAETLPHSIGGGGEYIDPELFLVVLGTSKERSFIMVI